MSGSKVMGGTRARLRTGGDFTITRPPFKNQSQADEQQLAQMLTQH